MKKLISLVAVILLLFSLSNNVNASNIDEVEGYIPISTNVRDRIYGNRWNAG